MGQRSGKRLSTTSEAAYFKQKTHEQIMHFTKVNGFLENSSEWVVLFRERFCKYKEYEWSLAVLKLLNQWESYQDCSSKIAFVWNRYSTTHVLNKVDQTRACLWQQSIADLQTFSYEIEIDPYKKALNSFLSEKPNCSLYQIIRTFKKSLVNYYCEKTLSKLVLKNNVRLEIHKYLEEVDSIVLDFISIIIEVIPKYFLDLPKNIEDIQGITRNAVISHEVLSLLVLLRKGNSNKLQEQYVKSLESFGEITIESDVLERFEIDQNENYVKAMKSLSDIAQCKSIGQMHDSVAFLMNYISMGLYDEKNPGHILDDGEIIKAFLLVIGKSSHSDLPHYVDILNKFLDNHTLDVKGVGKGIMKLTFIINNSKDWSSFISY